MESSIGEPEVHIRNGGTDVMLNWLRQHVHPIGRALNAEQLVEKVSGKPLTADSFLRYLENKIDNFGAC